MDESGIESLLGAYALDAVSKEEAAEIEAHLLVCARCRAEVAAHREVASLLGDGGAEAPAGVWDRIAAELTGDDAFAELPPIRLLKQARSKERRSERRRVLLPMGLAAAAVAAVLGIVSVQLAHLDNEVHQYQAIAQRGGIAPAVASVLLGQHRTVTLTNVTRSADVTVAVAPDGEAYWVRSNLGQLSTGRTYQLWALSDGRVVSLGLLGADPNAYAAFRLQPNMTELMVTAEPEGGTATPTTPVLARGSVAA